MKATLRVIATLAAVVGAASIASANSFTLPVGPQQSYGSPAFGSASASTIVSLSTLATDLGIGSLSPGDSISFNAVGEICFNPTGQNCSGSSSVNEVGVGSIVNPMIGGFLGAGGLGGGFIATGGTTLLNTGPIGTGDWTADFVNDFVVTAAGTGTITIPVGATSVVFVFRDNFYNDNSDFSGTLGVQANVAGAVPEPATYGLMLAGLGALVAFKRVRRA
jgi:hypothetical protein